MVLASNAKSDKDKCDSLLRTRRDKAHVKGDENEGEYEKTL
jgi:hypothetical protein